MTPLILPFLLEAKYDFDIKQIIIDKIKKNGVNYPIEKSKGSLKKYTEL